MAENPMPVHAQPHMHRAEWGVGCALVMLLGEHLDNRLPVFRGKESLDVQAFICGPGPRSPALTSSLTCTLAHSTPALLLRHPAHSHLGLLHHSCLHPSVEQMSPQLPSSSGVAPTQLLITL